MSCVENATSLITYYACQDEIVNKNEYIPDTFLPEHCKSRDISLDFNKWFELSTSS